jgi:hypothetical protein
MGHEDALHLLQACKHKHGVQVRTRIMLCSTILTRRSVFPVQVSCGGDVVSFCNNWEGLRVALVLWGAYCFLLSHLLMLLLTFQRGAVVYALLQLSRGKGGKS